MHLQLQQLHLQHGPISHHRDISRGIEGRNIFDISLGIYGQSLGQGAFALLELQLHLLLLLTPAQPSHGATSKAETRYFGFPWHPLSNAKAAPRHLKVRLPGLVNFAAQAPQAWTSTMPSGFWRETNLHIYCLYHTHAMAEIPGPHSPTPFIYIGLPAPVPITM